MFKENLNIVIKSLIFIKKHTEKALIYLNLDTICSCGDLQLNFTKEFRSPKSNLYSVQLECPA